MKLRGITEMKYGAVSLGCLLLCATFGCSDSPKPEVADKSQAEAEVAQAPAFAPPPPRKSTAGAAQTTTVAPLVQPQPTVATATAAPTGASVTAGTNVGRYVEEYRLRPIHRFLTPQNKHPLEDVFPVNTVAGPDGSSFFVERPGSEEKFGVPMRVGRTPSGQPQSMFKIVKHYDLIGWTPGKPFYAAAEDLNAMFPPGKLQPDTTDSQLPWSKIAPVEPDQAVPLPLPATEAAVGGRGRFLLMKLTDFRRRDHKHSLAVFDIKESAIRGIIKLESEQVVFAGGATRFIVVESRTETKFIDGSKTTREVTSYKFTRWNYDRLDAPEKQEEFEERPSAVHAVAMGRDSEGPLVLHIRMKNPSKDASENSYWDCDLEKLEPLRRGGDSKYDRLHPTLSFSDDGKLRYFNTSDGKSGSTRRTTDGSRKSLYTMAYRPHAKGLYRPEGTELFRYSDREAIFRNGLVTRVTMPFAYVVPCAPTGFWLSAGSPLGMDSTVAFALHVGADPRPLETFVLKTGKTKLESDDSFPFQHRIAYDPGSKKLAVVSADPPQVVTKAIDFEAILAKQKRHLLLVTSVPPPAPIQPELKYVYQVVVKATHGPVRYEMEWGPRNMTISPTGLIEWTPEPSPNTHQAAMIRITDQTGKRTYEVLDLEFFDRYNPYQ